MNLDLGIKVNKLSGFLINKGKIRNFDEWIQYNPNFNNFTYGWLKKRLLGVKSIKVSKIRLNKIFKVDRYG